MVTPWRTTWSSATARSSTAPAWRLPGRRRGDGGRIAAIGRIREPAREEIDAEGHVGDARLHRRPHAHGRAGLLGSARHVLVLARRDDRGDGPLRLHARAGARRAAARSSCATSSAPRTSPARRWPPASTGRWTTFAEYLDAVDRLPKGINYARQHRPLGAAHATRWASARSTERGDRRRPRRDGARARATRSRAGAYGFTTSRTHAPRDLRRPAGRVAARVVGRGARTSSA